MLSIGAQLYEESNRDRSTLQLEEVQRQAAATFGAGVTATVSLFTVPPDRCLYLGAFTFTCQAGINTARLVSISLRWRPQGGGVSHTIFARGGDGLVNTLTTQHDDTVFPQLLLPRGGIIEVIGARTGDLTNAGSLSCWITGMLIPPGNIARGS